MITFSLAKQIALALYHSLSQMSILILLHLEIKPFNFINNYLIMTLFQNKTLYKNIESYVITTFGVFLTSLGWMGFLIPSGITGGGASGVGALIYYATGLPVGISYFAINAILILVAIRVLGFPFGVKTIWGIISMSFFLGLFQGVIHHPLVQDGFMATVIGGMLSGAGVGLCFSQGGSTGGTDIVAMMVTKYRSTSPGRVSLYCDLIIISSSYFLFHSIEKMVYGYVMMAVSSYVIDLMITGLQQSYQMLIITRNHEAIASRIEKEVKRGITVLDGQGWYSKAEMKILIVICRKHEATQIFRIVKQVDPTAFLSFGSVMGVYGHGFDRIKS
jgi:uncharacterized membrane-anchored protein YitT (DUF2179 family)